MPYSKHPSSLRRQMPFCCTQVSESIPLMFVLSYRLVAGESSPEEVSTSIQNGYRRIDDSAGQGSAGPNRGYDRGGRGQNGYGGRGRGDRRPRRAGMDNQPRVPFSSTPASCMLSIMLACIAPSSALEPALAYTEFLVWCPSELVVISRTAAADLYSKGLGFAPLDTVLCAADSQAKVLRATEPPAAGACSGPQPQGG